MRKRRVGVTARASQIAGNGKPGRQIDSEMAAPLCKENTNGHQRREPQQRVRMEAWRQRRESQSAAEPNRERRKHPGAWKKEAHRRWEAQARCARITRCRI